MATLITKKGSKFVPSLNGVP